MWPAGHVGRLRSTSLSHSIGFTSCSLHGEKCVRHGGRCRMRPHKQMILPAQCCRTSTTMHFKPAEPPSGSRRITSLGRLSGIGSRTGFFFPGRSHFTKINSSWSSSGSTATGSSSNKPALQRIVRRPYSQREDPQKRKAPQGFCQWCASHR